MDLSWLESTFYGFVIGLTDILPISAQAHRLLLIKLYGIRSDPGLMRLFVHLAIFGGLYYSCHTQILKIMRARNLAKITKRKRKRPLDVKSLMDLSLWKTMLIPVILHGQDIVPGILDKDVSIKDIAPTVAKLLGCPADPDWEGTSIL